MNHQELQQAERALYHCEKIKEHYERTKGTAANKREQSTVVPMSFWNLIEEMLTDKKVHRRTLHFKKGDTVICRHHDKWLSGKVLFISHKKAVAKIVVEHGQHPTLYGTMAFLFSDVYKPL